MVILKSIRLKNSSNIGVNNKYFKYDQVLKGHAVIHFSLSCLYHTWNRINRGDLFCKQCLNLSLVYVTLGMMKNLIFGIAFSLFYMKNQYRKKQILLSLKCQLRDGYTVKSLGQVTHVLITAMWHVGVTGLVYPGEAPMISTLSFLFLVPVIDISGLHKQAKSAN